MNTSKLKNTTFVAVEQARDAGYTGMDIERMLNITIKDTIDADINNIDSVVLALTLAKTLVNNSMHLPAKCLIDGTQRTAKKMDDADTRIEAVIRCECARAYVSTVYGNLALAEMFLDSATALCNLVGDDDHLYILTKENDDIFNAKMIAKKNENITCQN